jgi:cytochrome c-type biogenesis protein CcsB
VRLVGVNETLANISSDFMIAALLIYSLAVLAFAGDFAFGRPRRAAAAVTKQARVAELATVGAGSGPDRSDSSVLDAALSEAVGSDGADTPDSAGRRPSGTVNVLPARQVPVLQAIKEAGNWVRAAVMLSIVGVIAHVTAVTTRGFAVHRAPWGDMYEFITALTCIAAIFFVYVMLKYRAWALGVFVMGAVVIALGLAETVIYTAAGPLVPALQSYWLSIHVTAMTLSTGIFFVAFVFGVLFLATDIYRSRVAAGKAEAGNGLLERIPSPEQLDKLTYRTIIFGFPVWTFGVIAGAIWADQAWGHYWSWDPVETWAFITWVLYAAYLHARATAGFRGRIAQYIQILGFLSLAFNILVVQVFITGMHSYAGLG